MRREVHFFCIDVYVVGVSYGSLVQMMRDKLFISFFFFCPDLLFSFRRARGGGGADLRAENRSPGGSRDGCGGAGAGRADAGESSSSRSKTEENSASGARGGSTGAAFPGDGGAAGAASLPGRNAPTAAPKFFEAVAPVVTRGGGAPPNWRSRSAAASETTRGTGIPKRLQRSGSGCHGFDSRVGGSAQDAGSARAGGAAVADGARGRAGAAERPPRRTGSAAGRVASDADAVAKREPMALAKPSKAPGAPSAGRAGAAGAGTSPSSAVRRRATPSAATSPVRSLRAASQGDASGGVWKAWTPRHACGGLASAAGGGGGGTAAARENPASVPGRRVAASRRRLPAQGAGVPARSRPGRTPAPSSSPANAVSANRSSPPP